MGFRLPVMMFEMLSSSCHGVRNVTFSHVRRLGNKPSHLLAKYAVSIVDFSVWMEVNFYFLEQAFHHDVMSFSI